MRISTLFIVLGVLCAAAAYSEHRGLRRKRLGEIYQLARARGLHTSLVSKCLAVLGSMLVLCGFWLFWSGH